MNISSFATRVARRSCQPYLLASHFALWSLICYLKRHNERAIICFACAALSKSAMVPLPLALVVFDVLIVQPSKARKKARKITFRHILVGVLKR